MVSLSRAFCIVLLLAATHAGAEERTWEINGVRLESGQVERLADDLAERTVESVDRNIEDLRLGSGQRKEMREIYRAVALDVYAEVIEVIEREDLDEDARREQVRELALAGQRRSSARLESVLDARQMELYSAWAADQVTSFESRRLDVRRRRRRR